jgi:hypothetical protein
LNEWSNLLARSTPISVHVDQHRDWAFQHKLLEVTCVDFKYTILFLGRYAYTVNLRDPNLWSRRRFTYESGNPAPAKAKDASGINWIKFGIPDISGVDLSGLCMAAGY